MLLVWCLEGMTTMAPIDDQSSQLLVSLNGIFVSENFCWMATAGWPLQHVQQKSGKEEEDNNA
jgi:hypothetical protein